MFVAAVAGGLAGEGTFLSGGLGEVCGGDPVWQEERFSYSDRGGR